MPQHKKIRLLCPLCGTSCRRPEDKYCSSKCQFEFQYQEYIRLWKLGGKTGNRGGVNSGVSVSNHVRRYLFEKFESKCQKCMWGETHPVTGLIPLTVEHVDGNSMNTTEGNLQLLCPNCHSLTPTYGNLNRGNGRQNRRVKE